MSVRRPTSAFNGGAATSIESRLSHPGQVKRIEEREDAKALPHFIQWFAWGLLDEFHRWEESPSVDPVERSWP